MKMPQVLRRLIGGTPLAGSSTNPDNPDEASQWRRFGGAMSRNLLQIDHLRMIAQCSRSAQVDGMARSHCRLVRAITIGAQEAGPEVRCKDEEARKALQSLVDDNWHAPENNLGACLGDFMDGLTTTGSLALTARVDRGADGTGSLRTSLGYLDPEGFASPGILVDPENARVPLAVLRAPWLVGGGGVVAHPILRADDSVHRLFADKPVGAEMALPRVERFGGPLQMVVGDPCFYLGINRCAPNQTLGISDLLPALDLMGLHDELVFGAARRSVNIGTYSVHVKCPEGSDRKEIDDILNNVRADLESGEGRAVGTTKDVDINAVVANLQAGEWATMEKMIRIRILIGLGPWPLPLFTDGGTTNIATAVEQGSPIANILLDRQNALRRFIVQIVWYMLRQYPEAKTLLAANPDTTIHLSLPVIVAKDTTRESNVWAVEINSILSAVQGGLLTLEAGQREFRDMSNRYGLHVAPEDAPDAAEFEAKRSLALPPLQDTIKKVSEGTPSGGTRKGVGGKGSSSADMPSGEMP